MLPPYPGQVGSPPRSELPTASGGLPLLGETSLSLPLEPLLLEATASSLTMSAVFESCVPENVVRFPSPLMDHSGRTQKLKQAKHQERAWHSHTVPVLGGGTRRAWLWQGHGDGPVRYRGVSTMQRGQSSVPSHRVCSPGSYLHSCAS